MAELQGPTADIAEFSTSFSLRGATADFLLDRAAAAMLDTIGVSLAARREPVVEIAIEWARKTFVSERSSLSPLGLCCSTSPLGSAFTGAIAAHALDYDDVSTVLPGHPSAILVPVILALGAEERIEGSALLESYVVGLHVMSCVAEALHGRAHYDKGWHSTSTIEPIGAVATAARLLNLTPEQTQTAIGIVGSRSAGSRANFGSMMKAVHAGNAAFDAIMAARLAQQGITANQELLEAPFGFFQLYGVSDSDPSAISAALWGPIDRWVGKIDVKRFPCCFQTHHALDATLEIRAHIPDISLIHRIEVTVSPGAVSALIHPQPSTPLEAKFSMHFAVAAALIDGGVGLTTFTPERFARQSVHELARRVTLNESDVPPGSLAPTKKRYAMVRVVDNENREYAAYVDTQKGSHTNTLNAFELRDKLVDCVAFGGVDLNVDHLEHSIASLVAGGNLDELGKVLPRVNDGQGQ